LVRLPRRPPRAIPRPHRRCPPRSPVAKIACDFAVLSCYHHSMTTTAKIGIVTVSDRASQGVYEDRGGPAIREYLAEILTSPFEIDARIIPDERPAIEQTLKSLCDDARCCLVVTTGGTGPAARDVTPEATLAVCEKEML